MHEAKTNTLFSSLVFLLNHFLLSHCSPLSNYFLLSFCRSIRLFLLFTPTQTVLSFLFPVFHSSFCHLSCSRPSFTTLINFSHFLPLTADVLSMLLITSNLFFFLYPAEEEDHHHLCGGEEVAAQVHHRPKGQHPAGDPGDHGGVCGDASSGLGLRDHHPQGRARQAGPGAHAGLRQGEEENHVKLFL